KGGIASKEPRQVTSLIPIGEKFDDGADLRLVFGLLVTVPPQRGVHLSEDELRGRRHGKPGLKRPAKRLQVPARIVPQRANDRDAGQRLAPDAARVTKLPARLRAGHVIAMVDQATFG